MPRVLLWAIAASWALRALVVSVSAYYGYDEGLAVNAAKFATASRFLEGASAAEKWRTLADWNTADRPLWMISNILFGRLVPSEGSSAFVLSLLASAIAVLALAGAAERIAGRPLAGIVVAAAAFSPLAFHYSTGVLATPLAVLWICLAIFAFSSPRWAIGEWIAGGLCLGLAFATHMAAGAPILGLAAGLGVSAVAAGRLPSLERRERLRRLLICPLSGALGAALPLVLMDRWARTAGSSYFGRLFHHENLTLHPGSFGPPGLWIRQLFELDPLLEVFALLILFGASRSRRPGRKVVAAVAAVLAVLLLLSLHDSTTRALVSLLGFAGIAVAMWRPAGFSRAYPPYGLGEALGTAAAAPLTQRTVLVAAAVTGGVLTACRSVSCMPRLTFPAWPLLVLALGAAALRRFGPIGQWPRRLAVLAAVLAAVGAFAALRLRNIEARSEAEAARHPGWVRLSYEDLWGYDDRVRAAGWISTRAGFDVAIAAPPAELYPVAAYEEEPYKLMLIRDTVRDFQLDGLVSQLEIIWAVMSFEPGPTVPPEVAAAGHTLRTPPGGAR